MKKVLTSILIALTAVFALSTGEYVKAEETLTDLYPQVNENFAELYGNSSWVFEFSGHRFHTAERTVRHLSNLTGVEELVDGELKTVFEPSALRSTPYPSSSNIIVNNLDRDIMFDVSSGLLNENMTYQNPRQVLSPSVTTRFWAYFDENGRLAMYEDEMMNLRHFTKVEDEDYWRLSTQEEIDIFEAASEEDKPENIVYSSGRISLTEEGYKAEPLKLHWGIVGQETPGTTIDPETGEEIPTVIQGYHSNVTGMDSRDVLIPAGWTVIAFGEHARNEPVFNWTSTFYDLIAEESDERAEFIYINRMPTFAGLNNISDNLQSEYPVVIVEYNGTADIDSLVAGVSARYIDKEDEISGDGFLSSYKNISFSIEVYEGEDIIKTIEVNWDETTKDYLVDDNLDFVDTNTFGKEYKLIYKTISPEDSTLIHEEVAFLTVGALPPQITGVEDQYYNIGDYFNPLEGLTSWDPENERDITDSLVFNHGAGFNPNNLPYGRHEVSVTASWLYVEKSSLSYKYPTRFLENPEDENPTITFDQYEVNLDRNDVTNIAANLPAVYTFESKDLIRNIATNTLFSAWGSVAVIVDYDGNVLTTYPFSGAPKVLNDNNEVVDMPDFTHASWVDTYFREDTFLIHTFGGALSAITREIVPGDKFEDVNRVEHFETVVSTTETFNVIVSDNLNPEIFVFRDNFTIQVGEFETVRDALFSNVIAIDNVSASLSIPAAVNRIDITVPGVHEVSVIATDESGNNVTATFTLTVVEGQSSEELDDLVTELEDKIADLEAQVDAKLEDHPTGTSIVVTIIIAVVAAGLSFGGAVLFLGKKA